MKTSEILRTVYNASQDGNVAQLGIAPEALQELESRGLLSGWNGSNGHFYMVTPKGKQGADLR